MAEDKQADPRDAEIERLRDVLMTIAAQASGDPRSTSRADCMAALAQAALREVPHDR